MTGVQTCALPILLLSDRIAILHQKRLVDIVDPQDSDAAAVVRRSIVGTEAHLVEPEIPEQ